jgi:hypothetical protein
MCVGLVVVLSLFYSFPFGMVNTCLAPEQNIYLYPPQINTATTWSTLWEGDVSRCMSEMVVTPDTEWFSDPLPYFFWRYLGPDAYLYSQSGEIHRLGPNEVISMDWFPYVNCSSVTSLKLLHVAFIFLFNVDDWLLLIIMSCAQSITPLRRDTHVDTVNHIYL